MKVLIKLEKLLTWTFLYGDKPHKLCSLQIPNSILNIICVVPLLALLVLMAHKIYLVLSNDGNFKDISDPVYMSIGASSTTLSYLSYAQNIPLITLILQSTQTIVRKSEFIEMVNGYANWNFHIKNISGINESDHGIYEAAELKFGKLMRKIYSFDLSVLLTIFAVPFLAPIATEVFGIKGLRKLWFAPFPVA